MADVSPGGTLPLSHWQANGYPTARALGRLYNPRTRRDGTTGWPVAAARAAINPFRQSLGRRPRVPVPRVAGTAHDAKGAEMGRHRLGVPIR